MYTNTHREGRDSKRQAAGQSRGRLRQRRNSQMQQLLMRARAHTSLLQQYSLYIAVEIMQCKNSNMTTCHYLFC